MLLFQLLDLKCADLGISSQCVKLVHDYWYHELAELKYVRPFGWVSCHTGFDCLDQKRTVVLFIDGLILSINDFLGHC